MDTDIAVAAYTKRQFAKRWNFGMTKVHELIARGELRAVKVGRHTRIPVEAEQEFAARLKSAVAA
jgi:excisionase family DNA binding protein